MQQWTVSKKDDQSKLGAFIASNLETFEILGTENISQRKIKLAIERSLCDVNGKLEQRASHVLKEGDTVTFWDEYVMFIPAQKHKYDESRILYEDDHLLAYNKPSGITTDQQGLIQILQEHYPSLKLLHRLDKDTNGVVIFAKTDEAEKGMLEKFKKRKIAKEYFAFCKGVPKEKKGSIKNYLGVLKTLKNQKIWGRFQKRRVFPLIQIGTFI